ncbi:MAG: hypothetical protein J5I93_29645 [Pirellulaceae bacterium]|nr:hypothetical protein [Pirellulaceae bacterium]
MSADFVIQRILDAAEPVAGGLVFRSTGDPVVNNAGTILTHGTLEGPGVTSANRFATAVGGTGQLELVVRTGDPIPGTSSPYLNRPSEPTLSSTGAVGFAESLSSLAGGSAAGGAIWIGSAGSVAPATPLDEWNSLPLESDMGVSAAGHSVYVRVVETTPAFVRAAMIGDQEVLREGDSIALAGGTYTVKQFNQTRVNQANAGDQFPLAVSLDPDPPGGSLTPAVLLLGPGGVEGGLRGQDLPTGVEGVTVSAVSGGDINGAGQYLITATLTGTGVTFQNNEVVFLAEGDQATMIAREGDVIPGSSALPFLKSSTDAVYVVGGGGHVLGRSDPFSQQSGTNAITLFQGDAWQVIAERDQQAPGLPAGVLFSSFAGAAVNDAGVVVFSAFVTGVGYGGKAGVWAYVGNELRNVIFEGDLIQVAPGEVIQASGVDMARVLGSGENGRRTVLTDDGRVAFFTTRGVLVADLARPAGTLGSISGLVWNDLDTDGLIDLEPGIPGIQVSLLASNGTTVLEGPILTDSTGSYEFGNLQSGTYRVKVTPPTGAGFTTTAGDAEIGGTGLSGSLIIAQGSNLEADAGLIMPPGSGPTADLTAPTTDVELTEYLNRTTSIPLSVRYSDADGIDHASLSETSLAVIRFDTRELLSLAQFDAISQSESLPGQAVVTYQLFPPDLGTWSSAAIGDYLIVTIPPTARDALGNSGAAGELVGLMSIVDNVPPAATAIYTTPRYISRENSPTLHVDIDITYFDYFAIDTTTITNENVRILRDGLPTDSIMIGNAAVDNYTTTSAQASYRAYPATIGVPFTAGYEGRYDIHAGSSPVEDISGNPSADDYLETFIVDFTPPSVEIVNYGQLLPPLRGASTYKLSLSLSDAFGIDSESFDATAELIRVRNHSTGQLLSVSRISVVEYQVGAPGGTWDQADEGTYVVEINTNDPRDLAGNRIVDGTQVGVFAYQERAWQNPSNRVDVNDDDVVSPVDALYGINELNNRTNSDRRTGQLFTRLSPNSPFFDVNGDDFMGPNDVLLVFNRLNTPPLANGEFTPNRLAPLAWELLPPAPSAGAATPAASPDFIVASSRHADWHLFDQSRGEVLCGDIAHQEHRLQGPQSSAASSFTTSKRSPSIDGAPWTASSLTSRLPSPRDEVVDELFRLPELDAPGAERMW